MAQLKAIIDKLLTRVSNAYIPEDMDYVSEKWAPNLQVAQNSGKIGNYGKDHLRIVNTVMGGRGKAPRLQSITRSSNTYLVEPHGLEGLVTKEDYRNVEDPYDAERDETLGLTTVLWLGKEKALADSLGSTSTITQNVTLSGTSQYNDYTNSDPLGDFKTARSTVRANGVPPNRAIMDWAVADTLAYHPGILEALGYTQNRAGQLSEAELAKAMGIQMLHIARAIYNTADEGQSDSLGAVWGKDIVFYYAPMAAGRYQKSVGYYITLSGQGSRQVSKTPTSNPPGGTEIVVVDDYDQVLVDVNDAYLIDSAIA